MRYLNPQEDSCISNTELTTKNIIISTVFPTYFVHNSQPHLLSPVSYLSINIFAWEPKIHLLLFKAIINMDEQR